MKTFKALVRITSLVLAFSASGCITSTTLEHASGADYTHEPKLPKEPKPALYLLTPLTIPADIVTSPFQVALHLWLQSQMTPSD